ncbi:hypothetical protein ACJJTC_003531 [Scirpophaga incertulas]
MSCVNDQVTSFTRCVLGLMDLHAPSKTRIFKHPPHPWITDTVKDMMRIRDDYHRQYRALRTSSTLNSYKDMKRLVSQATLANPGRRRITFRGIALIMVVNVSQLAFVQLSYDYDDQSTKKSTNHSLYPISLNNELNVDLFVSFWTLTLWVSVY